MVWRLAFFCSYPTCYDPPVIIRWLEQLVAQRIAKAKAIIAKDGR
jgi:hypothetical protein